MNRLIYPALMAILSFLPASAGRPAEIYAIGDFNDWQLPAGKELNGALPMALAEGSDDYYWEDLKIPAGSEEIMFFYNDTDSGEDIFLGSTLPPFTLYKFADSVSSTCTSGSARDEVSPIRLRDWRGSRIMGGVYPDSRRFTMASFDGPSFPNPAPEGKMYAMVGVDGHRPVAIELNDDEYDPYFWTISFGTDNAELSGLMAGASVVTILFSPQQTDADVADCWGKGMEVSDAESPERVAAEFLKGGEAFSFALTGGTSPSFSLSASCSTGLAFVKDDSRTTGPAMPVPRSEARVSYYDLQGKGVVEPRAGEIYLRIGDGKIEKIIF